MMKIAATLFHKPFHKTIQVKGNSKDIDTKKPHHTIKETIQQYVADIEEAKTNMGEDNPKAQELISKFKSGSKLTPEEMAYIREHAPGIVSYIDRIMKEREVIELAMKMAPTKTDVQLVAFRASKQIEKHKDPEERIVRAKHLADAKYTYEQTEEYKEKPNTPLEKRKKTTKVTNTNPEYKSIQLAIDTYAKATFKVK